MKRVSIKSLIYPAICLAWTAGCFCFFQAKFKFHFFYIEQNQLFLNSGDYLSEFFTRPAWLSCMAGAYFQQFYHFICGGAAVLTIFLTILGIVSFFSWKMLLGERLSKGSAVLPLILAILTAAVTARFYLYENTLLASTISFIIGMVLWLAYRTAAGHIKGGRAAEAGLFIAAGSLCWWLSGIGVSVCVGLELLACLREKRIPWSAVAFTAVVAALITPVSTFYRMEKSDTLTFPGMGKWISYEASQYVERMLAYDNVYYRGDYGQILGMYEHETGPRTKELTFLYSLSASQFGRLPEKLGYMKEPMLGTTIHMGRNSSLMVSRLMCELYYLIGDMTYAERMCMHANNFSINKRSARLIKRLAEINLVMGDETAAEKYLRMLRKSFLYRDWALEHTPGTMTEGVNKEIRFKRQFLNKVNTVNVGDDCRMILTGLLDSNRENVIALDYLLCTDIITGQKEAFFRDYEKYGPREKNLYKQIIGPKRK